MAWWPGYFFVFVHAVPLYDPIASTCRQKKLLAWLLRGLPGVRSRPVLKRPLQIRARAIQNNASLRA